MLSTPSVWRKKSVAMDILNFTDTQMEANVFAGLFMFVRWHLPLIIIVAVSNDQNWVCSPCKKQLLTCFVAFSSFENLYKLLLHEFDIFYKRN